MGDIHQTQKRLKSLTDRLGDTSLSDHNREIILEFKRYLEAQDSSNSHVLRHLYAFKSLAPEIDFPLDDPDKSDLRELVAKINRNDINGKDYSVHTLSKFKKVLSRFYRWKTGEDDPEIIDFLTTHVKKSDKPKTDPAELPTPEEVRQMLKSAKNKRDKALIFTLWDTGGRIGEVLNLQWRDIHFSDGLTEIRFRESKTGERIVPVRECVPALKEWKNEHPKSEELRNYVFVSMNTSSADGEAYEKQMSYRKALQTVKFVDKNSGVQKDLSPHDFRKGRATWLASQGMNGAQLMEYFGWDQMETAETYVRLAKKDLENAIRNIQGLSDNGEEEVEDLSPIRCSNCDTVNSAEKDFCRECGEIVSKSNELLKEQKKQEYKSEVKDDIISSLFDEIGLDKEKAEKRIRNKVRERLREEEII